jgi:hypothetical protein
MCDFKPTYLYVKQHSVTGLLYFGKTCQKYVETYKGSGTYWNAHINKHGKEHVITIWKKLYENKEELVRDALMYSALWNIVESNQWANLKPENGLEGWTPGTKKTREHIEKHRLAITGRSQSKESNAKRSNTLTGRKYDRERIKKSADSNRGKKQSPEHTAKSAKANSKPCTIDGITIYPSLKALIQCLGKGKNGSRSPGLKFV